MKDTLAAAGFTLLGLVALLSVLLPLALEGCTVGPKYANVSELPRDAKLSMTDLQQPFLLAVNLV